MGNELTKEDIPEIDEEIITPTFELYSDDVESHSKIKDIDDVTTEEMDQYLSLIHI